MSYGKSGIAPLALISLKNQHLSRRWKNVSIRTGHALALALLVIVGIISPARAAVPDTLKRPANALVVPEKFLRRWDPVTMFFDRDTGPAKGGPEDDPSHFVVMTPTHPGAFTWLDARTLQFRPAEPWPALAHFDWRIAGRETRLITLLPAPTQTLPADGATALASVDSVTLVMPEPVDPAILAQMVTIDLRPLPGLGDAPARMLRGDDLEIKTMERAGRTDAATYVLRFHEPIGGGMRALLHLRLSPESALEGVTHDIAFATAEPFRAVSFGCPGPRLPVTPTGVTYPAQNALRCDPANRSLVVQFSAPLGAIGPVAARNLVRLTPPVDELKFDAAGNELTIAGAFAAETLYRLRLEPSDVQDQDGRMLELTQASEVSLFFPAQERFLRWQVSQGIVERLGPQMAPLQGRGFDRLDLRVYPVDPLNRFFWPFPDRPVSTDEAARPPGPGEEPKAVGDQPHQITGHELVEHLKNLGSPAISEIVTTPLHKGGTAARFGLDLKPYFERIAGATAPGTYLVGIRRMDGSAERSWMRLQVTDLSLSTVEEADAVRFFVTSLATGAPVRGATLRIEGVTENRWTVFGEGRTGEDGQFSWKAPGPPAHGGALLRRIVVEKTGDTLVIDTTRPPPIAGEPAQATGEQWLQWTVSPHGDRGTPPELLCHLFTERPIYRPEEPVHVKAWLRNWKGGDFSPFTGKTALVVSGGETVEWRYPLEITPEGTAYRLFDEKTAATGDYEAHLEIAGNNCGTVTFKKEAYRLPRFEVQLAAPQKTGLDSAFAVDLAARYYAGGSVAARPLRWRVTQFSYDWQPAAREGFVFSSDARFSTLGQFRSTPVLEREVATDDDGNAKLTVDPTLEPTAQPRRYVVEATVTGEDDQTVTTTQHVLALPPFVLGAKLPRFLEKARSIDPEIIAVGPDGKTIAGQEVIARLLRRQWHSTLQATDFSQGVAKYVTDIVDEKIAETKIVTEEKAKALSLPIDRAGVYIVELEAQDRTGRAQTLAVDLFANGDQKLTWAREPAKKFVISSDKTAYAPGETATLVLQSPYQTGAALVVLEHADDRNDYRWVDVRNGAGHVRVDIAKKDMPKLPVHVVLLRGRVASESKNASSIDLSRPATVMSNMTLAITPVKHQVKVELAAPAQAQPGDEIDLTVNLRDDAGKPLAGEVTLWLVDQAVLALAPEQRLDPLPDFIVERESKLVVRDSRNLVLGLLPLQEMPGGDESKKEAPLLDRVAIRKNFTPVPYYNPRLMVGPSGSVTVKVKLADSLSNFMLRAKAVSGPDRFGFGTGMIAVRLPVIVEPALPRFVRPGDRFIAAAIGRVVEGEGGPGRAEIRVEGLNLKAPAAQNFNWEKAPKRIEIPVEVPSPGYTASGRLERDAVKLTFGVERSSDKAHDAFAVSLPLRPDREPVRKREMADLATGAPLTLPAIAEPYRPGTLKRSLTITAEPALLRLAAGLDYLREYPFACTEQRVSHVRAEIAARRFHDLLLFERTADRTEADYKATIAWIEGAIDGNDLVAYWPGTQGNVALTAWTMQFLTEAKAAGYAVDKALADRLASALGRALRSDFPFFLVGESLAERVWALQALAGAGIVDDGYAAELARRSALLSLESQAGVIEALSHSAQTDPAVMTNLTSGLWSGIVFRLVNGQEAYGGLQTDRLRAHPLLLPSEARTMARVIHASAGAGNDSRRRLLVNALVASAGPTGWGSTNANAEAFLALTDFFATASGGSGRGASITRGGEKREMTLDGAQPILRFTELHPEALVVSATGIGDPLGLLADTRYLPEADGSTVAAEAQGFVVAEAIQKVGAGQATALDQPGKRFDFAVGDVAEQQLELVNPEERHQIAIVMPLAAGMEPLNPNLATAPPEARPSEAPTLAPTYVAFLDDAVQYFYETLPKGTYRFAFRMRATVPGRFVAPAASAQMMYNEAVRGNGNGAEFVIERR